MGMGLQETERPTQCIPQATSVGGDGQEVQAQEAHGREQKERQ